MLFITGCLPSAPDEKLTMLADIRDLDVVVSATPDRVLVEVRDGDPLVDGPEPCIVLVPELAARILDIEVPVVERGRWVREDEGWNQCATPRLELDDPPRQEGLVFELGDPSLTIQCPLGGALVPRAITKVPVGPWEMTIGERVTIQHSRVGDLAPPSTYYVLFTQGGANFPASQITRADDLVTFTVPDLTPGSWTFEVNAYPAKMSCAGGKGGVGGQQTVLQPVTLAARS